MAHPAEIADTQWLSPSGHPVLETDDIHVWRIALDLAPVPAVNLYQLLTQDEIDRAQRFRFARDRDHFVVTRGALRLLLGRYLQIPARQIRFYYETYGKPMLAPDLSQRVINFNVSHSHELALLAFRLNDCVGVDMEYIRA